MSPTLSTGGLLVLAAGIIGLAGVVVLENLGDRLLYELLLRLPGIDKALHWIQYTGIFVILWWLSGGTRLGVRSRLGVAAVATVAIGIADEIVQGQFARRSMELADLAVDGAGVLAGLALVAVPGRRGTRLALLAASLAIAGGLGYRTHDQLKDYNQGLLDERRRDFVGARAHYQRALANGHRSPGLYNSLAWVEIESGIGDPAVAVRYAEAGLAVRPDAADLLDTYGWALLHAGRLAEARAALERARTLQPRSYSLSYHLGVVHARLGEPCAARRYFEEQRAAFPAADESLRAARALTELACRDTP